MNNKNKKVVIFQYRLLHYRVKLFEKMRTLLAARDIDLHVVYAQPAPRELSRNDEGQLSWATKVKNTYIDIGGKDLVWQPFPSEMKDADLVIVMQENRILSNYPLLHSRFWSRRKIAYWGHGKNFQSVIPSGFREKWKNIMITKIDWWFAYTQLTVDILLKANYPENKITRLDNAIDTSSFKADLATWSEDEVINSKNQLGISQMAPVALYCGSLYPEKRLELLIKSSDLVREKIPDFCLLVIGNGPSMSLMQEAAKTRPWLHLLGTCSGVKKALYFRMADLMLNPGLVGLHIVDAFCSGLVMITTETARHSPEVAYLRNGENGIYAGDSPAEYSKAVIDVISDSARLNLMKQAALADSEKYTIDNMVTNFVNGIESALKN
jgi:glycosyltransferase involved in cell wall biosynthesis